MQYARSFQRTRFDTQWTIVDGETAGELQQKSGSISRADTGNHRGLDRRDRFVEAQTAVIPALCPAEALNSGSRQRRSVIIRKKPGEGRWRDGEKKLCKEGIRHLPTVAPY